MRKNYERVFNLKNDLIRDINEWFDAKDDVLQIEFTRGLKVQIEIAGFGFDDDWSIETIVVNFLTNDGYVIDEDGGEIELQELNCVELAFILDELQENKFKIVSK